MTMINVLLTAKKATELSNDQISSDVETNLMLITGAIIHWAAEGDSAISYELYGSDSVVVAVVSILVSLGYQVEITDNNKQYKRLEITWN